jgi:hypothetical protein
LHRWGLATIPSLQGGPTKRHSNSGSFHEQVGFLRRQFLQGGDLPFTDVLTEELIAQALATIHGWLDRIFSPLVTLWVFLGFHTGRVNPLSLQRHQIREEVVQLLDGQLIRDVLRHH